MEDGEDGEMDSEEEGMEEDDDGEVNGDKNGVTEEEEEENGPEDPRAGRVNAFIPQVSVNYCKIAEELFKLGSGADVRKYNRDALYRISKKFKDVGEGSFPLGPNLSDIEVDVPKISVKKAAMELAKRNEKIRKENEESKRKARLLNKQKDLGNSDNQEESSEEDEENTEENTCVEEDEDEAETKDSETGNDEQLGTKSKR